MVSDGLEFTPDETITNQFRRCCQSDGIVLLDAVNRLVSKKLAISICRVKPVDGGDRTVFSISTLAFTLTEEDSSVFDFLNAPLGLLEDGTTKTFGHVLNSTELAEGSADGTLDGGGEALKDKVAVGVPGKGSILEEKVLVDGVLMGFSDTLPDAVLRSDEGTGEENGDGIDGVVHVGEVAHLTFGDDFGLLNTTAVSKGLDKAGIKLGKHAKKVVFRADFLGDATGEENGADGLATVPLEPPQDGAVGELGDGGGLGEHALGHTLGLVNSQHSAFCHASFGNFLFPGLFPATRFLFRFIAFICFFILFP